jgi:DNA polymerase-3 subunit alpha
MDGFGNPDEHMKRIADLEMPAAAVSEHGNVSSHVKWEQEAQKQGVKPLFGLEAYTAPKTMREDKNMRKWHMTMIAMDQRGYSNLMRMVTRSWTPEDNYRWPTVTGENLRANQEGLIILSGCADSHLACTLLGGKGIEYGDERKAEKLMLQYKRLLGDRYYLECQRFPRLERSRQINQKFEEWSKKHKIPLVATSDVHYPYPNQNEMQKILHAAGRNIGTVAAAEAGWEYDILLTYPQSDAEVTKDMRDTGLSKSAAEQSVENTAVIAERCNVVIPKMDRLEYPVSEEDLKPWT